MIRRTNTNCNVVNAGDFTRMQVKGPHLQSHLYLKMAVPVTYDPYADESRTRDG